MHNPRLARQEKERERAERKAKKQKEAKELKKKEEEEIKREEEENAVESDHHGRNFIDYSKPRPKYVPQVYEFS